MRRLYIFAASMLAVLIGAATLSGCQSGQGQQSITGASMNWRHNNSVPAGMVGDIINKRRR
ncbi:MAG: hypothetical protein WC026_17365 [Hyphomicrobium sp.]|uniref:hypothetical protein n=1 Tax=Hyphomicrobium sp. TaxID=82 RepID=UPI003563549D